MVIVEEINLIIFEANLIVFKGLNPWTCNVRVYAGCWCHWNLLSEEPDCGCNTEIYLQNCSLERSDCQTFKPHKILTSLELATQQASLTYASLIQATVTGLKPDKQFRICELNNKIQMKQTVWFPRNPFGYHGEGI